MTVRRACETDGVDVLTFLPTPWTTLRPEEVHVKPEEDVCKTSENRLGENCGYQRRLIE